MPKRERRGEKELRDRLLSDWLNLVALKESVAIKPSIQGKKTVGSLETMKNGMRFKSIKGVKVDIPYSQIANVFFHPCDEDLVVLIHINLSYPVTLNGKAAHDLQFYLEIANQFDDLNNDRRKRFTDADEFE
jgi:nucleosome binding factor SPN SPT16 subunit